MQLDDREITDEDRERLERIAFYFRRSMARAAEGDYADSAESFRLAGKFMRELEHPVLKRNAQALADAVDGHSIRLWREVRAVRARSVLGR